MTIIDQVRESFKDCRIGTEFTRQDIIDTICEKYGTNPTSVIPSDYCYNMTNKGKQASNVLNDFKIFVNIGSGLYKYVGENNMTEKIKSVIEAYKSNFEQINHEEIYKWEAIKCFQEHWDIEADNLVEMLTRSFEIAGNLLAARNYFPYKMVIQFAKEEPETVRILFKNLFNEELSLEKRYEDYRNGFHEFVQKYSDGSWKNHYQDLHAISVYITFRYPEKYYIYKYGIYKGFSELIDFQMSKSNSEVGKLENYFELCDTVLSVVNEDQQLTERSRDRLTENCYNDNKYHLLVMDIIFFGNSVNKTTDDVPKKVRHAVVEKPAVVAVITDVPKNVILYGPPGTGKTYNSIAYAVAIIENQKLEEVMNEDYSEVARRYHSYKKDGLIEFTTFHQSYGYEEFIEGIKPVMNIENEDENDIQYDIKSGIFKSFCERAVRPTLEDDMDMGINNSPVVWKVSLEGTGDNPTRQECMKNGHIRIGWDGYGSEINDETDFSENGGKNVLNAYINKMKIGDIIFSCYSATSIDAIGVVTGDYEWHEEYDRYSRLRKVNWIVKGINEDIVDINNGMTMTLSSVYRLNISLTDVMDIVNKNKPKSSILEANNKNYVFVIDEINRGNISKIFGELITLIEPTKRMGQTEGVSVRLPYSQKLFGVPNNIYIIGTMNTADRSIATIDTALRRRFYFKEMQPNPKLLEDIMIEDVSMSELHTIINKRISVLYDREHTIGHAYFMPLINNPTIELLANIFENNIIPLLQEYFYEDYEKIRMILGDCNKEDEADQFIISNIANYDELFGNMDIDMDEKPTYEINRKAFDNIEAYRLI